MADPIKKRIMDRVLSNLATLKPATARSVTRELDIEKVARDLPAILVYTSPEQQSGRDNRGRTFRFTLAVKCLLQDPRDIQSATEVMVAKVQQVMESDIQLNGLATLLDGEDVTYFVNELNKPVGGAFITYDIEYRRLRGDPYTTY
jgi:hypothetical protein